jgi:serine O-acetyltransferase
VNTRPSFFATIHEDLESFAELLGTPLNSVMAYVNVLMFPGVMSVLLFRLSGSFHRAGLRPLSRLLYILNVVLFSADLAPGAQVGPGLAIPHPVGVGLAAKAVLGKKVRLFMGVLVAGGPSDDPARDGFPTIGDGCYIFSHALVLGRVVVGDNAIIGANSVVLSSIPPGAIAFGSPARVSRYRNGYEPASSPATEGTPNAIDCFEVPVHPLPRL